MMEVMRILKALNLKLDRTVRLALWGGEEQGLTHHSSADTYDHAIHADLMQASAVIASVVYEAANRAERLPRRELPKAAPAATASGTP